MYNEIYGGNMDTVLAICGDIDMAKEISKNSSFVSESKKNPHFAEYMNGFKLIAQRSNYLSDAEVDALQRRRNNLYKKQLFTEINDLDELRYASEDTVKVGAMLSKYKDDLFNGKLSIATNITEQTGNVITGVAFGGTTGRKRKENGELDHTAKRVYATSTDTKVDEILNMSMDDKVRIINTAEVINSSDSDDPFTEWAEEELRRIESAKDRGNKRSLDNITNNTVNTSYTSSGNTDTYNWRSIYE